MLLAEAEAETLVLKVEPVEALPDALLELVAALTEDWTEAARPVSCSPVSPVLTTGLKKQLTKLRDLILGRRSVRVTGAVVIAGQARLVTGAEAGVVGGDTVVNLLLLLLRAQIDHVLGGA